MRAMCEVQLKDGKRSRDLMMTLGLNETIDQLAMAVSVCWYGHVIRREDDHVLGRSLHFEVDGRQRGHGRSWLRKKCEGWFEKRW